MKKHTENQIIEGVIWKQLLPLHPSLDMVILNYPVTWITTSVLFIFYYQYRKRKLN